MSLLAELFEGLETSTAGIDTLKTERIGSNGPALRFALSENVARDVTMSSREMSELTGKRHDSVKRTIETLAFKTDKEGKPAPVIGTPQIVEYLDTLGRPANEYHVSKRDSFVVVAQLCPEFTAALVDQHDGEPQHLIHTAATATLEWIAARDQYVSHLMACRACYAPTGRHCAAGAGLRQQYDQTPMERAQ